MLRLKFKFTFILLLFLFLNSCSNVDYINSNQSMSNISLTSNEIFDNLSYRLSLPNLKSLNEDELLELYAVDPKLLIDYIANISIDNISGIEISIFRLKEEEDITEVILGIERRINELENEFKSNTNKQNQYDLVKNSYTKTFNNYIVFSLYKDTDTLDKILQHIFN